MTSRLESRVANLEATVSPTGYRFIDTYGDERPEAEVLAFLAAEGVVVTDKDMLMHQGGSGPLSYAIVPVNMTHEEALDLLDVPDERH